MSNWATMKHQIFRDTHIDTTSTGTLADTDVGRAIIESIMFNRGHNLGWNVAHHMFYTDDNVQSYVLPQDYKSLSGDVFYSSVNDSSIPYGKRVLRNRPLDWVNESVTNAVSDSTTLHYDVGTTTCFAINPSDRKMYLSPIPTGGPWVVDFDYLRDPGTPWFKSDGTTWTFYNPNSEDTLASTFTNDWFDVDKGYHLVLNRAIYIVCNRGYGGTEEMAAIGANALRMWAEELVRLRAEANRIVSVDSVRKRI